MGNGARSSENESFKVLNLHWKQFTRKSDGYWAILTHNHWIYVWTVSNASSKLWTTRSQSSVHRFPWFLEQNEATFLYFQKNKTTKHVWKQFSRYLRKSSKLWIKNGKCFHVSLTGSDQKCWKKMRIFHFCDFLRSKLCFILIKVTLYQIWSQTEHFSYSTAHTNEWCWVGIAYSEGCFTCSKGVQINLACF